MSERFITFKSLNDLKNVKHCFTTRSPAIDVNCDKNEALIRLKSYYEKAIALLGFTYDKFIHLDQVHSDNVIIVNNADKAAQSLVEGDALITFERNILLGVFVADCCAVFISDKEGRGVSVVHSGKRGSELSIVKKTITTFKENGVCPADLIIQLSPCIKPPAYEVDFVKMITDDCLSCGVSEKSLFIDPRCTSKDANLFYSYRRERGKTGRMLALIGKKY